MSIISKLREEARRKSIPKDLSVFNDELAYKTEWLPLKGGGANFQTRVLKEVRSGSQGRIEFHVGFGLKMFRGIFVSVGLLLAIPSFLGFYFNVIQAPTFVFLVTGGIGLIFIIAGFLFYYFVSTPIIFDKRQGYFWKGRKSPSQVFNVEKIKTIAKLNDVHAIQLISETIPKGEHSYKSHEINLVLKDGSRANVIDHGNLDEILQDAKILSEFVSVPVWDSTRKED